MDEGTVAPGARHRVRREREPAKGRGGGAEVANRHEVRQAAEPVGRRRLEEEKAPVGCQGRVDRVPVALLAEWTDARAPCGAGAAVAQVDVEAVEHARAGSARVAGVVVVRRDGIEVCRDGLECDEAAVGGDRRESRVAVRRLTRSIRHADPLGRLGNTGALRTAEEDASIRYGETAIVDEEGGVDRLRHGEARRHVVGACRRGPAVHAQDRVDDVPVSVLVLIEKRPALASFWLEEGHDISLDRKRWEPERGLAQSRNGARAGAIDRDGLPRIAILEHENEIVIVVIVVQAGWIRARVRKRDLLAHREGEHAVGAREPFDGDRRSRLECIADARVTQAGALSVLAAAVMGIDLADSADPRAAR